jgi:hypothetical protein
MIHHLMYFLLNYSPDGANIEIGVNIIILQKECESILIFFSLFHMSLFLDEIFCNLLFKIHKVAPIDHIFCVNHC